MPKVRASAEGPGPAAATAAGTSAGPSRTGERGRIRRRALIAAGLSIATVVLGLHWRGAGRSLWYPYWVSVVGARTQSEVLAELRPRLQPGLKAVAAAQGIGYPPRRLTLVGLKAERQLEVWAEGSAGWRLLRTYAVLAASGGPGPKRREGDLQVPEGVYRLTNFNPNSSYHLSVRVDYPNGDDRAAARAEGRTRLGGDIYIHGKAVSIGCLAIGDAGIEELYVLLADVGLEHARAILVPRAEPEAAAADPRWVGELYARLRRELQAVRGR